MRTKKTTMNQKDKRKRNCNKMRRNATLFEQFQSQISKSYKEAKSIPRNKWRNTSSCSYLVQDSCHVNSFQNILLNGYKEPL